MEFQGLKARIYLYKEGLSDLFKGEMGKPIEWASGTSHGKRNAAVKMMPFTTNKDKFLMEAVSFWTDEMMWIAGRKSLITRVFNQEYRMNSSAAFHRIIYVNINLQQNLLVNPKAILIMTAIDLIFSNFKFGDLFHSVFIQLAKDKKSIKYAWTISLDVQPNLIDQLGNVMYAYCVSLGLVVDQVFVSIKDSGKRKVTQPVKPLKVMAALEKLNDFQVFHPEKSLKSNPLEPELTCHWVLMYEQKKSDLIKTMSGLKVYLILCRFVMMFIGPLVILMNNILRWDALFSWSSQKSPKPLRQCSGLIEFIAASKVLWINCIRHGRTWPFPLWNQTTVFLKILMVFQERYCRPPHGCLRFS